MHRLVSNSRRYIKGLNHYIIKRKISDININNDKKLFDKILIANRGEIACRIIRSCQKLGIKTVAIYSEPDVNSVAVRMADEAVCVGPAASKHSYLNISKILEAVKSTGAQAVHPGYGFLSENPSFCLELEKIGVNFIGPGHKAISAMGDKIESKLLAKKAGVNIIPGFLGIIKDEKEAVKIANSIGYPVMIKASAGGGGKGMRVAYNDKEAIIGFRLSKEEAASSFGDDRLFVEKFIENPRHIEIQLLADKHGNIVPFPERECSIQRRNQKVIEEAPSCLLDDNTRRKMGEQVKMLVKEVNYISAGTVEFLCDQNKNFYFLEMNTRLQVEHPITELITKVDIVEQMIRIAAGEKLPDHLLNKQLPIYGWAMECRVYAEDPFRGFLPSIGRLIKYSDPSFLNKNTKNNESGYREDDAIIRVDSGVEEGSDISMYYDPMISKLVTHAKTRKKAIEKMREALNNYVIRGPGHNINFLIDVLRHPRFNDGKTISTKFIQEEYPKGFSGVKLNSKEINQMLLGTLYIFLRDSEYAYIHHQHQNNINNNRKISYKKLTKRNCLVPSTNDCIENRMDFMLPAVILDDKENKERTIQIREYLLEEENDPNIWKTLFIGKDGSFGILEEVKITRLYHNVNDYENANIESSTLLIAFKTRNDDDSSENSKKNEILALSNVEWDYFSPLFHANVHSINGNERITLQLLKPVAEGYKTQYHGAIHNVVIRNKKQHNLSKYMKPEIVIDTSRFLQCPMPGMLISVAVNEGDQVEIGQELAVVEAMKMQNVLRAERRGKIKKIFQIPGDSLKVDQNILELMYE